MRRALNYPKLWIIFIIFAWLKIAHVFYMWSIKYCAIALVAIVFVYLVSFSLFIVGRLRCPSMCHTPCQSNESFPLSTQSAPYLRHRDAIRAATSTSVKLAGRYSRSFSVGAPLPGSPATPCSRPAPPPTVPLRAAVRAVRAGGASIIVDIALAENDRNTSSGTQLQCDSFAHFKHFDRASFAEHFHPHTAFCQPVSAVCCYAASYLNKSINAKCAIFLPFLWFCCCCLSTTTGSHRRTVRLIPINFGRGPISSSRFQAINNAYCSIVAGPSECVCVHIIFNLHNNNNSNGRDHNAKRLELVCW